MGARFIDRLAALDGIADARGRGLMIGVSLAEGLDAGEVAAQGLEEGLVINVPGPGMLRFLPPLIVGEEEIDAAGAIIARAIG